ncbi:hypothetical protein ACXYMU_18030 [Pontibacter sp. CAU 1760]
MQSLHQEQDLSLLNVAADKAREVIKIFPAGTSFKFMGSELQKVSTPLQASEAGALLDQVDFSAVTFSNLTLREPSKPTHIFVLSDFQRSTFSPTWLQRIDSVTQVHLVPLQAATTSNVTIDSVYLEDEFVRPAADNLLHVRLFNTGETSLENVPVKLLVGAQQLGSLSVNLPPQQATEVMMTFRVDGTTGPKEARIQVEDYPVEFDNTYYFVLAPSKAIQIVEVTDERNENTLQQLYQQEPFFQFTTSNAARLNYAQAGTADIILLNGPENISAALATTISNYVKAGGSVVIIPPAKTAGEGFNTLLQNLGITASLTRTAPANGQTKLAAPDPNNPFFRSIFSEYDAKMQLPSAIRSLAWSRASEDILKYRGGAPFLSRFDRGNGHVYLMAAPLNPDYNGLASHALLVPVMYKLALSSYRQQQALAYTISAGTIQVPAVSKAKKEGVYSIRKDSVTYIPEQQVRGGKLYFSVPPDMDEAGFYTLQLQDSSITTLAFNYEKAESYLAAYTPDELRAMVRPGQNNVHVYDQHAPLSVKNAFEKRYFGVKLWKYCLILCLFFLMAEIALIRFL